MGVHFFHIHRLCRYLLSTLGTQISTLSFLQIRILDEIDIFFILGSHFVLVEWETFADPAKEEPYASEEYEELQNPVNQGVGWPAVFPFRGKLVGTLVDPAPVEDEEAYHASGHEEEGDGTDVIQHDPLEPEHWFIHGKEYFSRGHHDAHESIVSDEDEGAECEEGNHQKTEGGGYPLSHIDPADHVHHEEDEEQGSERCEGVGTQMIEGRVVDAIDCMDEDVGKYEYP